MNPLLLTILVFLLCFSAPAQAEEGGTKQDILQTYGEPFWKGEDTPREVWYYPHQRMFIYFEGDRVVEIDVVTGEKI